MCFRRLPGVRYPVASIVPRRTWQEHEHVVAQLLNGCFYRCSTDTAQSLSLDDPRVLGRVVAHDVCAVTAVPAFDNSQMDGYALRSADVEAATAQLPITLPLGVTTAAGDPPQLHLAGTASPIMTGAAIPQGADTVIPVEQALPPAFPTLHRAGTRPKKIETVAFSQPSAPGLFVRQQGEDRSAGAVVARAGTRVTPALVGSLAATGNFRIAVRRALRVLLCSTGDELLDDSEPTTIGRIHDANTPMLVAALVSEGVEVTTLRTGDDPGSFRAALSQSAADHDFIVTTGGVSAGAFEVVRTALQFDPVTFCSLALQPGGPQGCGTLNIAGRDVPVLCFPGNPVSAFLSAEMFLLPLLRQARDLAPHREETHVLAEDVRSPADKHQVRRGMLDNDKRVHVFAPGSHLISELADAELLVHLPVGVAHAPAGASVLTWRINV